MNGKSWNRPNSEHLLRDLREALENDSAPSSGDEGRLDFRRAERTGTPEIILAENKSLDQLLRFTREMVERNGSVLLSRVAAHQWEELKNSLPSLRFDHPSGASMIRVYRNPEGNHVLDGRVAIFTAGTSDLPYAHEVRLVSEEMGVEARVWADMGVAGLHRLIPPFREAMDWNASVIVVVAGMDGALPSVIAGLSPVPTIGLPVSTGYGHGGGGEGALTTMLQSCAPGLTVVNIDNSVGAGISAARIARQSV